MNVEIASPSKWSILQERRDALRKELDELNKQLDGLLNTNCGLTCSGCGTYLETEADFAKHFIVPDRRYLNLGECPQKVSEKGVNNHDC